MHWHLKEQRNSEVYLKQSKEKDYEIYKNYVCIFSSDHVAFAASICGGKAGISFKADVKYATTKTFEEAPVTFEAWINLPSTVTGRGGVILGSYGANAKNISFEITKNGAPRFYANDGTIDVICTNAAVNTGEWVHLAMVYRASQKAVLCYVNGQLKGTLTDKVQLDSALDTTNALCLGGDYRGGNEQYFKGQIASAAVYSDERTAAEIASDMNSYGKDGLIASYDASTLSNGKIVDGSGNGYDMVQKAVWIDPDDIGELPEFAYSFAVVGDTQIIAETYPTRMAEIYDWIIDNSEENKTKFVFGLGDITNSNTIEEWNVAASNIKKLDGKIPYSIVRGNHDGITQYKQNFPMTEYEGVVSGSYYGDMLNTYHTLTVGSVKYLMICLDFGASTDILKWAGDIIEKHPDHNVIITTHAYLYRDGTTLDAKDICPPTGYGLYNNGDHIWEILASKYENVVLVMSGHDPCDNIIMSQVKGDHGNTVTQMLVDPQGADVTYGGVGAVAMLYFSEDGKDVTVRYYSTLKEKYFMSDSQFSMTLDLAGDVVNSENNNTNNDNSNNNNNSDNSGADNNGNAGNEPPKNDGTSKPEDTTGTTQGTEAPKRGGCGSVMSVSAVGVAALAALGACFVPKKKRR